MHKSGRRRTWKRLISSHLRPETIPPASVGFPAAHAQKYTIASDQISMGVGGVISRERGGRGDGVGGIMRRERRWAGGSPAAPAPIFN